MSFSATRFRAALLCATLATLAPAAMAAEPTVIYTATGTFGSVISGGDLLELAGQPFSISVPANEALKPTRQNDMSAEYTGLTVSGTSNTGLLPGTMYPVTSNKVNIELRVGGPGTPDQFKIGYPLSVVGSTVRVTAEVEMPPGTITATAIQPFTAPVTFNLINVRVKYTAKASGESAVLGIANGTLTATLQQ